MKENDVLKPQDLEKILHVGRAAVSKLLNDGKIKHVKIGNSRRIPRQYLDEFLLSQQEESSEEDAN